MAWAISLAAIEIPRFPQIVSTWPKGHAMEKSPEPAPRRFGAIEISLDGGKT